MEASRKPLKTESSTHSEKSSANSQIEEYVSFINLMGEAVGKSQKATKGLTHIEWFTGVFYIYKRFLKERKNMEAWLDRKQNRLVRPGKAIDQAAFDKWASSEQRTTLLAKVKKDNAEIEKAINKMHQSILKRNIDPRVVKHADLAVYSEEDSFIAMEYGLAECDDLLEMDEMSEDLLLHIVEIIDSLFIIAELDAKPCHLVNVRERKALKGDQGLAYFEKQEKFIPKLKRYYAIDDE